MIRIILVLLTLTVNYESNAEIICKGSPISQGIYFNKIPPKSWSNCIGGYTYLHGGGIYHGRFMSGKPYGDGRLELSDGSYIEGNWINGVIAEHVLIVTVDQNRYEGQWLDGKFTGTAWLNNNIKYEGSWINGQLEGYGSVLYSNKTSYKGNLKEGIYTGYGEISYQDGSRYHGNWKNGSKNGEGTLIFSDGKEYAGHRRMGRYVGNIDAKPQFTEDTKLKN